MFYYGIIYREDEYEAQKWLSRSVGTGNKYAGQKIFALIYHI